MIVSLKELFIISCLNEAVSLNFHNIYFFGCDYSRVGSVVGTASAFASYINITILRFSGALLNQQATYDQHVADDHKLNSSFCGLYKFIKRFIFDITKF